MFCLYMKNRSTEVYQTVLLDFVYCMPTNYVTVASEVEFITEVKFFIALSLILIDARAKRILS